MGVTTWAVIGGGPSVRNFPVRQLDHLPTIAVNMAYRIAPWAKIALFGDIRWRDEFYNDLLASFKGEIATTVAVPEPKPARVKVYKISDCDAAFETGEYLHPPDSGSKAIHLAFLRGAKRILLAGFDMSMDAGCANWHTEYPWEPRPEDYAKHFPAHHVRLYKALQKRGVEVLRVTEPGLREIPFQRFEEVV